MKINKFLALFLVLMLAAGFGTNRAFADSASLDFEGYALGTVNGQDGWSSTGAFDHQVVDPIPFGVTTWGSRSLRISNAVTSGSFGDQTFSKSLADEAGESIGSDAYNNGYSGGTRQSYFEAQWDFASTVPGAEQVGLS